MPLNKATFRERCARIAIGLVLVVGPIIGCNNDDEYYPYYSSSGVAFGGSSSTGGFGTSSGYGYTTDGGKELCETVTEGVSCYSARISTSRSSVMK